MLQLFNNNIGSTLFHGPVPDSTWNQRCDDLSRAVERLSSIASQDALILLRASFSAPKVLHLLRCSPSVSHPSLERFDALLKQAIQRITNSVLSDLQWIQASLPVRDGGLGWSWSETCVFARTSRLFGFCGKHIVPPGRHPD